jgi:putative hydrolase of the HAD superfamily
VRGFQQLLKTIKAKASDCIMLEDNLEALKTAKKLGMKTVLVSKKLHKPSFVDYRIPSVLALTHIHI